jgi:hypothetical protein
MRASNRSGAASCPRACRGSEQHGERGDRRRDGDRCAGEPHIVEARDVRWGVGDEQAECSDRDEEPEHAAGYRDRQRFGEELSHEVPKGSA